MLKLSHLWPIIRVMAERPNNRARAHRPLATTEGSCQPLQRVGATSRGLQTRSDPGLLPSAASTRTFPTEDLLSHTRGRAPMRMFQKAPIPPTKTKNGTFGTSRSQRNDPAPVRLSPLPTAALGFSPRRPSCIKTVPFTPTRNQNDAFDPCLCSPAPLPPLPPRSPALLDVPCWPVYACGVRFDRGRQGWRR